MPTGLATSGAPIIAQYSVSAD